MNTAVLISIRPKWCELIASGQKTIEVRKNAPKIETPFKCYIYCTKLHPGEPDSMINLNGRTSFYMPQCGTVIGEFVCDKTEVYDYEYCTHPEIGMDYDCGDNWFCVDDTALKNACMSYEELRAYAANKDAYGWHISDLVIYDKPKELSDFRMVNMECLRHGEDGVPVCEKGILCQICQVRRPPQSWCYVVRND